jgi:hypothetical protein
LSEFPDSDRRKVRPALSAPSRTMRKANTNGIGGQCRQSPCNS